MFPPQKQRRVPPFIFQTDVPDSGMQVQGPLGTQVVYPDEPEVYGQINSLAVAGSSGQFPAYCWQQIDVTNGGQYTSTGALLASAGVCSVPAGYIATGYAYDISGLSTIPTGGVVRMYRRGTWDATTGLEEWYFVSPLTAAIELKGLTFTADTSSTAGNPASGKFQWNNATQPLATQLTFSEDTADGADSSSYFESLGLVNVVTSRTGNGFLYIQQADDSSRWQLWQWSNVAISGVIGTNATFTLDAAYLTRGSALSTPSPIQNGKLCYFMFIGFPDASEDTSGFVNILAQKFKGAKTFDDTATFGTTAAASTIGDGFGVIQSLSSSTIRTDQLQVDNQHTSAGNQKSLQTLTYTGATIADWVLEVRPDDYGTVGLEARASLSIRDAVPEVEFNIAGVGGGTFYSVGGSKGGSGTGGGGDTFVGGLFISAGTPAPPTAIDGGSF